MTDIQVLIVEDQVLVRKMIQGKLEDLGYGIVGQAAGILLGVGITDVDVARPALQGDLTSLLVKLDNTKSGSPRGQLVAAVWLHGGIGSGPTCDLVAQPVKVLTGILWHSRLAVLVRFQRSPPAQVQVGDRRYAERVARIVPVVDTMMEDGCQMLVAGNMDGESSADFVQCLVTTGLKYPPS